MVTVDTKLTRHSEPEGSGPRRCGLLTSILTEVPVVVHETRCSMSDYKLWAYPVLRRDVVLAASGARTPVDVSDLQQTSPI